MSTCDTCRRPGRCCTGLVLSPSPDHPTTLHALVWLATLYPSTDPDRDPQVGLPFVPLWRAPAGHWSYWCPHLTPEGRCGDYENRPQLCVDYQPGSDALCAEYEAPT